MQKNGGKHTNQTVSPFWLASFPPMVRLQMDLCNYALCFVNSYSEQVKSKSFICFHK